MGNFFDDIVIFLEDNYVYVIGVGSIIILMLIGFLASSNKARKQAKTDGNMANINDVNTGNINDVANTVQQNSMQPVDVVTFDQGNTPAPAAPVMENTPTTSETVSTPVAEPITTTVTNEQVTGDINGINQTEPIIAPTDISGSVSSPIASDNVVEPVVQSSEPIVQSADTIIQPSGSAVKTPEPVVEASPNLEDKFDKTEVIDFSTSLPPTPTSPSTPVTPVETKPEESAPFVVDKSQYDDSILHGEASSNEVPKV